MFKMNLSEMNEAKQRAFSELVEEAGSLNHLAKMLNVDANLVKGWAKRGQVSKVGAGLVEIHPTLGVKFKAVSLRPDM